MDARVLDCIRLTLPLLIPSVGGLVYLYSFGAPARLVMINAGALAAALVWIALGRLPANPSVRLTLAAAATLALFAPLLIGPEVGGVSRWVPAGPVLLHSGTLLLPFLVVLAANETEFGPVLFALAGAALALQPDAAGLVGLAGASAVLACLHRSKAFAIIAPAGLVLAVLTCGAGGLEPQAFTEDVLAQVAERSMLQAAALAALLFAAPLWHLVLSPRRRCAQGHGLAALLLGLGAMAMIAPFPFPLIGYGAAPILGFGLALGAAARSARTD